MVQQTRPFYLRDFRVLCNKLLSLSHILNYRIQFYGLKIRFNVIKHAFSNNRLKIQIIFQKASPESQQIAHLRSLLTIMVNILKFHVVKSKLEDKFCVNMSHFFVGF